MPKSTCRCGSLLDDDDSQTTNLFLIFSSHDWEKREAESDWRKQIPYTYEAWECKVCGRIYLYKFDEESPSKIFMPDTD